MNVVFVNGQFPQTSQTFVLSQIDHALESGDRVAVYCRLLEPGIAHPLIAKWDLYRSILYAKPVDRTILRRTALGALRFPKRFAKAVRLRRAKAITWNELFFAMQLTRKPDLFLANFGPNGLVAAKLKRHFFPAAKLAVIFHGYDITSYVKTHGWDRYQALASDIDLAVAVNRRWAALLKEHCGMDALVHYLGAPVAAIRPWRGHAGGEFRILFVGRMTEKKGFDVLLEAFRILRDGGRDVVLHAVGGGPQYARHMALAESLGLADRIVAYGARPHDFVLELMAECDAFAAPSLTASDGDAEGLPVTLKEAMACGIPVVSTHHSGIPELVEDGESGLLAAERDAPGLAAALARLMDEPEFGSRLAAAARRRVQDNFDAAKQNRILFARLRTLVAQERVAAQTGPG